MFKTIQDIKDKNKELGSFWFAKETMESWGCKIETGVLRGRYFITSEKCFSDATKKAFSIRRAKKNGEIETISFQKHSSLKDAKAALKDHISSLI